MDLVSAKVREILAIELQIDEDRVVPQAMLRADLGMDSVAALNILFAAEEALCVTPIDATELADVRTVADVESLVRRHYPDPTAPGALARGSRVA